MCLRTKVDQAAGGKWLEAYTKHAGKQTHAAADERRGGGLGKGRGGGVQFDTVGTVGRSGAPHGERGHHVLGFNTM
jgi:hypothetical protein